MNIMFKKLTDLGISGYIFKSILSLYNNVECCVNVNGFYTDWFSVNLFVCLFVFNDAPTLMGH